MELLAQLDSIEIDGHSLISASDTEFCRREQEMLYQCLDQLERWHDFFADQADMLRDRYKWKFDETGKIVELDRIRQENDVEENHYDDFLWKPFSQFKILADAKRRACRNFGCRIISHFNEKYRITVPVPSLEETDEMLSTDRPQYMRYVNMVIDHLDGKSFRAKAEEEIITSALHAAKNGPFGGTPRIQGHTISVYGIADLYTSYRGELHLSSYSKDRIDNLCAGLALFDWNRLDGGTCIIEGFDADNIDTSQWYGLTTDRCRRIKFYKNGRLDIRFTSPADAADCFTKLRLYTLKEGK